MTILRDLMVLVADKDAEHAVKGLLSRPESLGIRPITFNLLPHADHDPGCVCTAHELLRRHASTHDRALVLFDYDGCGLESTPAQEIEAMVRARLCQNGWQEERIEVIAIVPELEAWVWSDSPNTASILGWTDAHRDVHAWLSEQGFPPNPMGKPSPPKEAMERVLRNCRKPWSAAIFEQLATKVTFRGCVDPSFRRFTDCLREWFPQT